MREILNKIIKCFHKLVVNKTKCIGNINILQKKKNIYRFAGIHVKFIDKIRLYVYLITYRMKNSEQ